MSSTYLTIASCNLQNLYEHSSPYKIMHFILALSDPLELPDVIALQEIGANANGQDIVHSIIAKTLIAEIERVTGSRYRYIEIAPKAGTTGGALDLNIRPAFLIKEEIELINSAEIGSDDDAFTGNIELNYHPSRTPLAITIRKAKKILTLINCHLKSANARTNKEKKLAKRQRNRQAEVIVNYYQSLDEEHNIILLGDFNDFPNSDTLKTLVSTQLISSWDHFSGRLYTTKHKNCPIVLDYILIDKRLSFRNAESHHINTNLIYPFRYSDHDPISVEVALQE